MKIVIDSGVYGLRLGKGRVRQVRRGETVDVSDTEAGRLIAIGIASPASGSLGASDGILAAEKAEDQTPENGTRTEIPSMATLLKMPRAKLEELAVKTGADISGAESNKERAEILHEYAEAGEEKTKPLTLSTEGDIII